MGCPHVRGDNSRALASGLSYVHVDKHGITILYHLHQCRPCTSRDIGAKVGKGGIRLNMRAPTRSFQALFVISLFLDRLRGSHQSQL